MVLLVIKSKEDYFCIKDGEYHKCHIDKASVYPLDKIDTVRSHIDNLIKIGEEDASLYKLTISEEPCNI
ncbi:MAG: hypothetical protein SVZ03_07905 [Spirochaetota bacterium]|nr:hypothetical protein [Spirochaetota bacterium]